MKQYENKMLLLFGNSEFWPIKISTQNKWLHAKRRALQIYVSCCIGPWAKVCVWLPLRADQRGTFYMSRELFRERKQAEFWIDEKQETNKNELLIAFLVRSFNFSWLIKQNYYSFMEQYHLVNVLVAGEVVQVAGDGVVASLHRLQVVTSGELVVHPCGGCRWWSKSSLWRPLPWHPTAPPPCKITGRQRCSRDVGTFHSLFA